VRHQVLAKHEIHHLPAQLVTIRVSRGTAAPRGRHGKMVAGQRALQAIPQRSSVAVAEEQVGLLVGRSRQTMAVGKNVDSIVRRNHTFTQLSEGSVAE
jgi:hypothetical protein